METLQVERAGRHRHRDDEPTVTQERGQPRDVRRAPRRVPVHLGRPRRRTGSSSSPAPRATSAPAPTSRRSATVQMHQLSWMRQVGATCVALHELPQPVIAKVEGVAVGAGANLALGCDLIVAAEDARFSEIFSPARAVDRLRRFVRAAPAGRAAQGQGAGLLRRHHLGQGGARARDREPGRRPTPTSTPSSPTGPHGSRPARRSRCR